MAEIRVENLHKRFGEFAAVRGRIGSDRIDFLEDLFQWLTFQT